MDPEFVQTLHVNNAGTANNGATDMNLQLDVPQDPRPAYWPSQEINGVAVQSYHDQGMGASSSVVHTFDPTYGMNIVMPSTSAAIPNLINVAAFQGFAQPVYYAEESSSQEFLTPINPNVYLADMQDRQMNNYYTSFSYDDQNYLLVNNNRNESGDSSDSSSDEEGMQQSSDEEDYYQIINNIQNCCIDVDNRNNGAPQFNPAPPPPPGPSSSPRPSSWRRSTQRSHYGGRTRDRTNPYRTAYRYEARGMSYEELFPNYYYFMGNDELFYPIHVPEPPTFLTLEQMVFSVPADPPLPLSYPPMYPPSYHQFRIPGIGWAPWSRIEGETMNTNPVQDPPAPASNALPLSSSQSSRIRSSSTENIPVLSDPVDVENNDEQDGAYALPLEGASSESQTKLVRSTSIPDLNVIGFCPICTQALHKKDVASTFCGHLFCMYCIRKAIIINGKKCPTCRRSLTWPCYHQVYF